MLQVELTNIEDIYNSYKTTIISAIDLLHTNPSFNGQSQSHIHHRRSLLPFLGDALRWLMGTATTNDINSIKTQINHLIETQSSQQETLVHVISILNITKYAAQVNRQSINILMDVAEATSHESNNLYNLTMSLAASISFHQLILNISMVSTHTMDYINAATSGTLSPHILPVMDLQKNVFIKCKFPKILKSKNYKRVCVFELPTDTNQTIHIVIHMKVLWLWIMK